MKHAPRLLAGLAILVLGLAGCGTSELASPAPGAGRALSADPASGAGPASSADPAKAGASTPEPSDSAGDVMFLQMMVTQERQTAALIRLVRGRSVSAPTRVLTAAIRATQADEADSMVAWLRRHDQPVKADPDPELHAHHGGLTTLTAADLAELRRARGSDFERRILNVLLGQQHNAIELARANAGTASDPWVKDLAERVDRSRTAEIAEMLKMVAALPAGGG